MDSKVLTLVTGRLYFGLDALKLRSVANRVLLRVAGLPRDRATVGVQTLAQDFGVNTVAGQAFAGELVGGGLLAPYPAHLGDYTLTEHFREVAAARVVEPLPRARARLLLVKARELAQHINAEWKRNPHEIETLAVYGSFMSRDTKLPDLSFGVVLCDRLPKRRARWGRMADATQGKSEIRVGFEELSTFIQMRVADRVQDVPRPFRVLFQVDA